MARLRHVGSSTGLCVCLLFSFAWSATARAEDDPGRPTSSLILTPDAYLAAVTAWVDQVAAASLDPQVPQVLAAGRDAARRDDWAGADAALDNLPAAHVPPGLVHLLRGMVAAGRGDVAQHLAALEQAAPALAAADHTDVAVLTWRYLAQAHVDAGAPAAARARLAQALIQAPEDPAIPYLLGQVAWAQQDYPSALRAWERTTVLAPNDAVAWAAVAQAAAAAGGRREASLAAGEVLRLAPRWTGFRIRAARWLLADGQGEAAFNLLLPVAGEAGDLPAIRRLLERATDLMGGAEALAAQADRLQAEDSTADEWAVVAQRLSKAGALEDAAAAYRAALTRDPTRGDLGFLLAGVLANLWDIHGAIAAYEQAQANGFSAVGCAFNLGLMHRAAEAYPASIAAFDACLAAGGIPAYVLTMRGDTEFRAGRLDDAARTLAESLALDPSAPSTWTTYAHVLRAQGLDRPAREAFLRALELKPEDRATRYWLGRTALNLEHPDEALEWFRAEYARHGTAADLAYWAGVAFQRAGQPDAARFVFERALQQEPGFADAWRGVAELDQAHGRLDAARRSYTRALALGSRAPALHFRLGELAWVRGAYEEARTALVRTVELDPSFTAAWQQLGAVYAELGDTGAARNAFAHAYGPERMAWFMERSLRRFFTGTLWIGGFLIVLILGARLKRRPEYAWYPLFVGRLDLAVLAVLALLIPIILLVASQRMLYASYQLQRLANRQAQGLNTALAFRDGLFLALFPVGYLWWRHGRPRFGPLRDRRVWRNAAIGVGGFVLFVAPGLVMRLLDQDVMGASAFPRTRTLFNATPQNMIASILGIGIVSSVAQEIFYRGILYRLSRDQVGAVLAALVSAALFAAFHFQPASFWWYAAFGLLACAIYQRTGSLVAPAVMHVFYNVTQVIL